MAVIFWRYEKRRFLLGGPGNTIIRRCFFGGLQFGGTFSAGSGFRFFGGTAFGGSRYRELWRYFRQYRDRPNSRPNDGGKSTDEDPKYKIPNKEFQNNARRLLKRVSGETANSQRCSSVHPALVHLTALATANYSGIFSLVIDMQIFSATTCAQASARRVVGEETQDSTSR